MVVVVKARETRRKGIWFGTLLILLLVVIQDSLARTLEDDFLYQIVSSKLSSSIITIMRFKSFSFLYILTHWNRDR